MVDSTQPVGATATVEDVAHKPRHHEDRPQPLAIPSRPHDALVLSDHARHDLIARTLRVQAVHGAELELALPESAFRRFGKLAFHDVLDECDEISAPAIANTILEAIVGYMRSAWSAERPEDPEESSEFVDAVDTGVVRGLDAAVDALAHFDIEGEDVDALRDAVEQRVHADLRAILGPSSERS